MNNITNPWIALSSYEECDEYRFFGRKEDTIKLLSMLEQNDCIVIYSASGDGKSSVINAGLSPAMRRKGFFPLKIVFSTKELNGNGLPLKDKSLKIDFDTLIWNKIHNSLEHYQRKFREIHNLGEDFVFEFINIDNSRIQSNDSDLWEIFRCSIIQDSLGVSDFIPVIIFDQFEEVLRSNWRSEFFAWLENLMKDSSTQRDSHSSSRNIHLRKLVKLIFSMRYEYVGELDYWCSQRYFIPQMMQNRYFLKPLSKNQAFEIIKLTETFDETSKKLANNAEVIVESITSDNKYSKNTDDEVPAIILSLTCHVLYNEWQDNEDFSLNEIGLNDIIYDYYKSIIIRIGVTEEQRRIIERTLISRKGTRLRIPVSDERLLSANINGLISGEKNLIDEHIIKCEKTNEETYIELIHDKLAESIYMKREAENLSLFRETKSKRFKNLVFISLIASIIIVFVWFSKYSLSHEKGYIPEKAYIMEQSESTPLNIAIKDVNDLNSDTIEYEKASSLTMSNDLDSCRSYRKCYKNTLWAYGYPFRYAGNAEQLTFPFKERYGSLNFGENTKRVTLFYPELVDSIHTSSSLTEIYVPFYKYEQTLLNPKFRDVAVVKMNYLQTFYEKLTYALYHEHVHTFGMEIPFWSTLLIVYIPIALFTVKYYKKYSLNQKIKYISFSLIFTAFIYVLFIEARWAGWINTLTINPIHIIIIAYVCISLYKSLISYISKKIYNLDNHRYNLSILYTDKLSKRFSSELKRHFVSKGINDRDVNYDLLIFKNDYLDLNRFRKTLENTNRAIIVFDSTLIDINDASFIKLWKIINSTSFLMYPIILGEIDDPSKLPKALKNKRGSLNIFPSININQKDSLLEISKIDKAIKSKLTPVQKLRFKIFFLSVFLLLISMALLEGLS